MLFRAAAECAALCVSEIFVDNKTMEIKGGLGSNVYPSVDEGVFAMTNRIVASVMKVSDGTASVTRQRKRGSTPKLVEKQLPIGVKQVSAA